MIHNLYLNSNSLSIINNNSTKNTNNNTNNVRNKNSLFSLLKSNNIINYAKTDKNLLNNRINKIKNNLTISINLTKPKNNKNKTH